MNSCRRAIGSPNALVSKMVFLRAGRFFGLFCLMSVAGCGDHGTDSQNASFQKIVWNLRVFETVGGPRDTIRDGRTYSVCFVSDSALQVQADCNTCTGIYHAVPTAVDTQITINTLGCTKVFCGPQSLDTRFLNALSTANACTLLGNTLIVSYNHRLQLLIFKSASSSAAQTKALSHRIMKDET
jgi:heat shock protein HslJ